MAFLHVHYFLLILPFLGVNTQGTEDSKDCDKEHGYTTIKWPFPAPNGQNVNYMPMMPMAVPVVQGPKGDRGEPGTCDRSQCKCDCPNLGTPRTHERRALRAPGDNTYKRTTHPKNYEYYRGSAPQSLKMGAMKGEKGAMGVMGLTGLPGPAGPAGSKGQKGESGTSVSGRYLPGSKGDRGSPGSKGDRGSPGSKGDRGSPGSKGDRGSPGLRGFPGATGLRGPQGPPGLPGRSGNRGLPGRKGEPSLPGRPGSGGKKGEPGKPGNPGSPGASGQGSTEKRVAFTAAMTENVGPVQLATPIKFKDIILNQGAAYNLITGIFTAPYTGTYVFTLNALSQYSKAVELTLIHNTRVISSIHSRDTSGYAGAGNSIVVHLLKGDRLWVELSAGYYYVYGDNGRHTIFSGYLLYPD